ncbi:SDR family NAD(P)-dependent oxidoreductase [Commensalibacter papalotli (ex Botero et al. 2024)]|uniref:Nucleoside-diphosphate-sugar epimerase (WcaG) (PDB:2X4G) n=1 Tax=Commensalibacter papalotli (ex Botero et al. 2024) TaxID=2972766 RepID=A0ABM9HT57_9PROT|nr:SDR family NAD(P)-dependent oxidoreductase [Commensalibacter papalotli (ex Botero et al. 2024)]CAI3952110.1 Nucleoside-diphosphate-sugar epimerase (WcaG) (PDB:2X4G) [Commensalibacter papalotli (ex Botero et al. 2024)]CAI3952633.1 Nucleoside-diphosphate-sugar epimerase (WcaG) (PDB:2X4G) [Commensalibacter papalotli (ex Botero et al. 2024)]
MVFLITGASGFIGFHLAKALLARGNTVIGIDNLNDYYSPLLKQARCDQLKQFQNFYFYQMDIADQPAMESILKQHHDIKIIFNLAAQAGVRYSLENPFAYIQTNITGHLTILELARHLPKLQRIFYASSSSVYGLNKRLPFSEQDRVDRPSSVYAASKQSAELLSFTYHHLYGLKQTGLRFFTVYGPWGRPDMAYYLFAKAIAENKPITLYEGENLSRDFTYISDVIDGLISLLECPDLDGYEIYNIGNSRQEQVENLITCLEKSMQKKAKINRITRPNTDIEATLSDITAIYKKTGWSPKTRLDEGIRYFTDWFQNFNN